jgi:site-specific DNA recombinase
MITTAAIYARVSSARQKEEQTIASQTEALRAFAAAEGLDVPQEWIFEDEGVSGATLIRPELERLRDLAAEIEIPVVLCHSPDRLARRYAYQALLIEEFARAGTEVRFIKGPKAKTPEDELLLQFQGMIAEYERAQITERTRRGKLHRARSGSAAVLSGAPYGYRYVRKSEEAEARYEIVEPEAVVVRELFRLYVDENESIAGLSRWLGDQGIVTATGKTRWDRSTIWGMLRNPAYCGRAAFGKTRMVSARPKMTRPVRRKGKRIPPSGQVTRDQPESDWIEIAVPPIVSDQSFQLAARRLQDNRRFAPRGTKEPSFLQGLVACATCGYSYYRTSTRTKKRRLYYYRCLGSDDYRYENGRVCSSRPVRQDYLEDLVWGHVTRLMADPGLIRAEIERRLSDLRATSPITAQKSRLELEFSRCTRAKTRLLEAYQEELVSLDELRARMPDLRKKESTLRVQLDALKAETLDQETYVALAESLETFFERLRDGAETCAVEERQRIVRLLVKEVLVDPERILIRHSIPTRNPDSDGSYPLRWRSHHSALRRALRRRSEHARSLLNGSLQPALHIKVNPALRAVMSHRSHHQVVGQTSKEVLNVQVDDPVLLPTPLTSFSQSIVSTAAWSCTKRRGMKLWFHLTFQELFDHGLCDAVGDCRDSQRTPPTTLLGDLHAPDGRREIAARRHPIPNLVQIAFQVGLESRQRLTIYPRRSSIRSDPLVRFPDRLFGYLVRLAATTWLLPHRLTTSLG